MTIAPDQRGRGLARSLLNEAVRRMQDEGQAVSALYPTTASLYRSLGWEISGWWAQTFVSVSGSTSADGRGVVGTGLAHRRRAAPCVRGLCPRSRRMGRPAARLVVRASGPAATRRATPTWSWVGRRGADPVAAVVYHHTTSDRGLFDLEADLVAGVDGPALTDALAFLGGHGTTADRVLTTLPSSRCWPATWPKGRGPRCKFDWPWMLRLVDVPRAFAARGWPAGVSIELDLGVTSASHTSSHEDVQRWQLRVDDGAVECDPGGRGTIVLSAGDLASLYAGGVDPAALAAEGRLSGADERMLSALRAAFAGDPTLPWFF